VYTKAATKIATSEITIIGPGSIFKEADKSIPEMDETAPKITRKGRYLDRFPLMIRAAAAGGYK
jgi:hypothetical protein